MTDSIGSTGEDIAALYLEQSGFTILERNFKLKNKNEIDIIAESSEGILVAVEVKTSEQPSEIMPYERVTDDQISRIKHALSVYAEQSKRNESVMRVDVLGIVLSTKEIDHFSSVDLTD